MPGDQSSDACQNLIELIQRKLEFLFVDYGFKTIHRADSKLGERCLFVLESKDCRLRVVSEFGADAVFDLFQIDNHRQKRRSLEEFFSA
jgi:hypothetical protein